jgi:DNA-binding transcriptional MerR regulator
VSEAAERREGGKTERRERSDGLLTTGDMARLSNNTLRTVRFYEEAGILQPDRRSAGGHRLFSRRQLERLRFITDMRLAGLSLEEIRELLDLKPGSATGLEAADRLEAALDRQVDALGEKVRQLNRLQRELRRVHKLLQECRRCTDEDWEPWRCEDCDLWEGKGRLPQSMRVLWFPERPAGRRAGRQ